MPNSSPRRLVEFSRAALDSNLERLGDLGNDVIIDVRCNAYGHGAQWVEDAARARGFQHFVTDDDPTADIPPSASVLYGVDGGTRVGILSGEVVAIKSIPAGDSVSYGYTWTASKQTTLALVTLGFADGLPRQGSNSCTMSIDGLPFPVVGRIAMDQCVLDVTDHPISVGSLARVWDTTTNLREWSAVSRRDPLSLIANVSWRVDKAWRA